MAIFTDIDQVPLFRYGLIHADPPWHIENWGADDNPRSPAGHYRTESIGNLKNWPVERLLAPDAVLVMWTHPSHSPARSEAVLRSWGCRYVTQGAWAKVQKGDRTKPKIGLGHTLRNAHEVFFVGSVGKPGFHDRGIPSLIIEPPRKHSQKPEGIYTLCDRLAPPNTFKLDLFSRQERPGWDAFGDEVEPCG